MYRVTTEFTGALVAGGGINHLYFDEAAGGAEDAVSAASDFWLAVAEHMSSGVAINVSGDVELVNASTGQVTGIESTDSVTFAGVSGAEPLPPATQGLVSWRTGSYVNGREIRGRTFLPGMLELDNETGVPGNDLKGDVAAAIGGLLAAPDAELVIYSRTRAAQATVVTGTMWSKYAQLRSRRD